MLRNAYLITLVYKEFIAQYFFGVKQHMVYVYTLYACSKLPDADMQTEINSLRQCITALEAEKVKLKAEFKIKNSEISKLKKNLLRIENTNDRVAKLEQKQLQNNNTLNNNLSNFNSDAEYHEKPLKNKEIDDFLNKIHKKRIGKNSKKPKIELKISCNIKPITNEIKGPEKEDFSNRLPDSKGNPSTINAINGQTCPTGDPFLKIATKFNARFIGRKINKLFGYEYDPVTLKKIKGIGSHVNEISETVITISAHNSDNNFSDISDITDYFKEEGANESIEENSKKSKVITKADDNDDMYFYSKDEKEEEMNKEMQKELTAPIPLLHISNSSDNSKEKVWFDEDTFFNETNTSKVNTVTLDDSDDDEYNGYGVITIMMKDIKEKAFQ
ncbi:hypothetical protein C1645_820413 [Glomus cerebriforme]|uniref:Uncharacterized protein n=1 Tax=Glomus cerebriforme TaxID=658196 RepID=A0A397T2H9_9GLOM|nr:hypothetical protein C1645_820413 [Glomus cerebriforme]